MGGEGNQRQRTEERTTIKAARRLLRPLPVPLLPRPPCALPSVDSGSTASRLQADRRESADRAFEARGSGKAARTQRRNDGDALRSYAQPQILVELVAVALLQR